MKIQKIAEFIEARVLGNSDADVWRLMSVQSAEEDALVFAEDPKQLPPALESRAAAVITGDFASGATTAKTLLIVRQPKLAFARAAALLQKAPSKEDQIHLTAVIAESARLRKGVSIGAHTVIGEHATIGVDTALETNCHIGDRVQIGAQCRIKSNVTIYPGTKIGDRAVIHAGVVLGSDGFGYVRDETTGKYHQFPQIGSLEIGDDFEIGANSTVDRGALDRTVIGHGVKIDNLVHVGHNVEIGDNVVIAAQTGISGSAVIEKNVIVAGQVGIADHVRVEEGAILGAQCGVPSNKVIRGKGILFWGTPARPIKEYLKELAVVSRLAKKK